LELLIIVGLSLLLVPVVVFTSGVLRIGLGLLFVLFFPGYTLIAALFPRKGSMTSMERVFLSFGLSIAVVPLIGLVLNYTPFGIRLEPILLSVLGFILAMAGLALYRRRRLLLEERFEVNFKGGLSHLALGWRGQGPWDRVLTVVLGLVIVSAIGTLVYVIQTPKVGERFTQFMILGLGGKMEDYPRQVMLGREAGVIVEITNQEHEPTVYHLQIEIDGQKVEEVGPIALEHGKKWQQEVTFTPIRAGPDQKVEFQLYRGEESEPYHVLHLWIDVEER